jgi:hypothetical protein
MAEKTKSIRVNAKLKRKVERHIKKRKQTIGGYYDLAVEEKMLRDIMLDPFVKKTLLVNGAEFKDD